MAQKFISSINSENFITRMHYENFITESDVGGQGQRKSGQLCLVLVRPDRQTADRVFLRNPDKIRTADRIETDRVRTDRHRKAFFSKNPDRIQTADKIETDRTRTDRHRTACFPKIRTESGQRTESRQTESGQTDTWQKILTESGQRTDTGQDFPENPDKNETRTGHGQCCPPTSVCDKDSILEDFLFENSSERLFIQKYYHFANIDVNFMAFYR